MYNKSIDNVNDNDNMPLLYFDTPVQQSEHQPGTLLRC